jgi:hypothetical protein
MKLASTTHLALLAALGLTVVGCGMPMPTGDATPDVTVDSAAPSRDGNSTDATPPTDTGITTDTGAVTDTGVVEDTGVSPVDSGVIEDTGVAPMDSGVAPMDSGVAPMDSGVIVDSGVRVDSGVGPMDTGVIVDSGVRVDTGVPPMDTGVIVDSGIGDTGVAIDASGGPAGTVYLMNATADFSQSGFAVSEIINGVPTGNNDGWAVMGGGVARTAVFETFANTASYAGGTDLVITLHQNSALGSGYTLGRFRFAVTTADRAQFADGLASGGNLGAPAIWTTARTITATGSGGPTMVIQSDQSVLVSGANPQTTTYTIRIRTPLTGITGIKLETLTHPSFLNSGPGRSADGNFIVTEMTVAESAAPIPATASIPFGAIPAAAAATVSQSGYAVSEAIDGMIPSGSATNNGWGISDAMGNTLAQTAVFETSADTPTYGGVGTRLVFDMHQLFGNAHIAGRFRFSVTTANRSMFCDGLASGGNVGGAIWTPVTVRATSATTGSASFTVLSDGSIRTSGVSAAAVFSIVATTPLEAITGVRLEALADPALPDSGPGHAASGNFVLTELQLAAGPQI